MHFILYNDKINKVEELFKTFPPHIIYCILASIISSNNKDSKEKKLELLDIMIYTLENRCGVDKYKEYYDKVIEIKNIISEE